MVAGLMGERTKCRFRFSGPRAGSPPRLHGPRCREGWDLGSPWIRMTKRSWLQTTVNLTPPLGSVLSAPGQLELPLAEEERPLPEPSAETLIFLGL